MATFTLLDGRSMPVLGYGTWRCDAALLHDSVIAAVKSGFRHFDCAAMYFNEGVVGKALQLCIQDGLVKREDLFITSKIMPTDMHVHKLEPALTKTLQAIGLGGYIDLYLLHWPFRFVEKPSAFPVPEAERLGYDAAAILDIWRELERFVDNGWIKSLGVSNFSRKKLGLLFAEARHKPVNNQLEMHPALQQQAVVDWHAERGIVITCYCPLGSPARPPTFRHGDKDPSFLDHPTILSIAQGHGKTPAQVLLKWAIARGTVPLPKSTTAARIVENYGAADPAWTLTREEMEAMKALDEGYRLSRGESYAPAGMEWTQLWDEDL